MKEADYARHCTTRTHRDDWISLGLYSCWLLDGEIGATNVLRTLGRVPALIVLIFDLFKGIGPTLIATLVPVFYGAGWGPTVAGLAALIGHIYPVFIGFKGGRGVLTGAGALLVISPLTFFISFVTLAIAILTSRYVSLGSIVGSLTTIICGILFYFIGLLNPAFFGKVTLAQLVFLVIGPALVIIVHYDNIGRLLSGTERKLGQKVAVEEGTSPTNSSSSNAKA